VAAFGVTLAIMNFSFYQAFARIPLGLAMVVAALLVTPAAAAGSAGRGDPLPARCDRHRDRGQRRGGARQRAGPGRSGPA
jgi:threonine/homoserine efflux transporter RhtA